MNRHFKGIWIPKEIWLNGDLSLPCKVMLAEVESLSGEKGCFASNGYFAKFFNMTNGRASQIISELKELGLINIRYEGNKGTEQRFITLKKSYPRPTGSEFDDIAKGISFDPDSQLIFPWDTKRFKKSWYSWRKYLNELNKPYNGVMSEQVALKRLYGDSSKNEHNAMAMIDKAIAMGWRDLYPAFDGAQTSTTHKIVDMTPTTTPEQEAEEKKLAKYYQDVRDGKIVPDPVKPNGRHQNSNIAKRLREIKPT